jgi:hypothetical protein
MMLHLYMREFLGYYCGVLVHTGVPQCGGLKTRHEHQHSVAPHSGILLVSCRLPASGAVMIVLSCTVSVLMRAGGGSALFAAVWHVFDTHPHSLFECFSRWCDRAVSASQGGNIVACLFCLGLWQSSQTETLRHHAILCGSL